jgi:hypothetical protein
METSEDIARWVICALDGCSSLALTLLELVLPSAPQSAISAKASTVLVIIAYMREAK